jgi:hypothetical protein
MSLCVVLAGGYTVLLLILEPAAIGIDKQRPVSTVTVHNIPVTISVLIIGVMPLGKYI